jgi:D-alanyl-D-alanine carboxypeptidase/D-alanyl-D-alanine-endopeptidase (penicillin-binding protein 4)
MAALLRVAHDAPWAPDFLASLPVAGQDGTLANRLKEGPATGRARLKTGTLRDAIGLAGYVRDAAEREWIFVALLNHPEAAAKGRPVLDALANWVASLK